MTTPAASTLHTAGAMGLQYRLVRAELERLLRDRGLANDDELHQAITALVLLTGWHHREAARINQAQTR